MCLSTCLFQDFAVGVGRCQVPKFLEGGRGEGEGNGNREGGGGNKSVLMFMGENQRKGKVGETKAPPCGLFSEINPVCYNNYMQGCYGTVLSVGAGIEHIYIWQLGGTCTLS